MSIKSKMTEKTLKNIVAITGVKLTLGKLIWAIRQADDIAQIDFAKKLQISKQQLSDIEHGKAVSPKLAAKYAKILGYPTEQFIRLALQDLVDRLNLNVQVEITKKKGRKNEGSDKAA
ncbi:MAG: helix-turn-helix transcriptional regulator [Pseudomonadota bacterium]